MSAAIHHVSGEDTIILSEELSSRIKVKNHRKQLDETLQCVLDVAGQEFECKFMSFFADESSTTICARISVDIVGKIVATSLGDVIVLLYSGEDNIFNSRSSSLSLESKEVKASSEDDWIFTLKFSKICD